MKHAIAFLSIALLLISCSSTKQKPPETMTPNKALLIDGSWEANYIMNTPKPFAELYAKVKPSITFNSTEGKLSGITGCNNFTGSFTLDGNKISIPENLALTRKMCPDMSGEQAFLDALKKVNSYSVTEQGKTLNLIMGDMAIMRLQRK
jgi:heat shock protein HslJ